MWSMCWCSANPTCPTSTISGSQPTATGHESCAFAAAFVACGSTETGVTDLGMCSGDFALGRPHSVDRCFGSTLHARQLDLSTSVASTKRISGASAAHLATPRQSTAPRSQPLPSLRLGSEPVTSSSGACAAPSPQMHRTIKTKGCVLGFLNCTNIQRVTETMHHRHCLDSAPHKSANISDNISCLSVFPPPLRRRASKCTEEEEGTKEKRQTKTNLKEQI